MHPLASTPPSHHIWSSGHGTGQAAGHAVTPSNINPDQLHVSGIGHPEGSIPPGHMVRSVGHTVGQKAGQSPVPKMIIFHHLFTSHYIRLICESTSC